MLTSGTRSFHHINYLGSVRWGAGVPRATAYPAARPYDQPGSAAALMPSPEAALARRMDFPVGWDSFFRDTMTLEEVYRYGTQHYDFHRAQLTLK